MIETPTVNEMLEILAANVRGKIVTEEDAQYVLIGAHRGEQRSRLTVDVDKIQNIINCFDIYEVAGETAIRNPLDYEILVREESPTPIRRFRDGSLQIEDKDNEVGYEISTASPFYVFWLLYKAHNHIDVDLPPLTAFFGPRWSSIVEQWDRKCFVDFVSERCARFITLKIRTKTHTSQSEHEKLMHSFLFHFTYNTDIAFVPVRLLEEVYRRDRIARMRRSKMSEIDPPRRVYNEDLVHHYLQGVSSDNPVIEYLSYYHIIEHFFESVFNEDLIDKTRNIITGPGFSYKRKRDITFLINSIKKSMKVQSETIAFSEQDALRLCLQKFVSPSTLKSKLAEYDEKLIEYYRQTAVSFSDGPSFDLSHGEQLKIFGPLSKRIYKTRNALVHSKDGERSKYTPFRNDSCLVKETPLLRFIAEAIILDASTVQ